MLADGVEKETKNTTTPDAPAMVSLSLNVSVWIGAGRREQGERERTYLPRGAFFRAVV